MWVLVFHKGQKVMRLHKNPTLAICHLFYSSFFTPLLYLPSPLLPPSLHRPSQPQIPRTRPDPDIEEARRGDPRLRRYIPVA